MKIEIENPCRENWNRMTPDHEGAFCLSCQKNVIDFSKKTLEEIKDFFKGLSSPENVCGRFREKQLDGLSFEYFFEQFQNWRLVKKIALVFFFVFGMNTFSYGQTKPVEGDRAKMGEVYVAPADTVRKHHKKDSVNTAKGKIKAVMRQQKHKDEGKVMGKPAFKPDIERKD
jgi:hypothetical protein